MDIGDFSERTTNDLRSPKPPRKPTVILQNLTPPPGCPDYMEMNHAVMGIPRPPLAETRSFLLEKKKVPIGWPSCLKRSPPKATFNNNDIYARSAESSKNLYKEPHENKTEEDQGPKEKNMRVFYKLNIDKNTNIASTPHKEEYAEQNYESIEEWETPL